MNIFLAQSRRVLASVLHLFCLILLMAGVYLLYSNSTYGQGITWLRTGTYSSTAAFSSQLEDDIDAIFQYSKYRDAFETDHALDMSKQVVRISDGNPDNDRSYTLQEMVDLAQSFGYALDQNWEIQEIPVSDEEIDDEDPWSVEWKSYDPEPNYSEPIDAYMTLNDLSYEVLSCLGRYCRVYYDFMQNPTNLHFKLTYWESDPDIKPQMVSNTDMTPEEFLQQGRYAVYSLDSLEAQYNLADDPLYIPLLLETYNPNDEGHGTFYVAVDTNYPAADSYFAANHRFLQTQHRYGRGMILLAVGAAGCLATFAYLAALSGWKTPERKERYAYKYDYLPAEIGVLLALLALLGVLYLTDTVGTSFITLLFSHRNQAFASRMLDGLAIYAVCFVCAFSLIRQYKSGRLWHSSLTRRLISDIQKYMASHRASAALSYFYLAFLAFNLVLAFGLVFLFYSLDTTLHKLLFAFLFLVWCAGDIWVFHSLFRKVVQQDKINEAISNISTGDTRYCVDLDEFSGRERQIAEHINHIGIGLDTALQDRVKSERMKTDLITNVSHDLKTPLTSIINYVDLMKRENIQNPKVQEYLEILEQKSQRLKTLTEDLVEASKASSGNLKLEMADIDLVELVQQTNGEFEEKFTARRLELISHLPDEAIVIRADGGRLWRVLENLYNNACKYAMEHSRIYVDVVQNADHVVFSIKNISNYPLNITSDELTERFVRGDVSRTTEGSGLGLSIAQSLTKLQGGEFTIVIDGDLFKACLQFPVISEEKDL